MQWCIFLGIEHEFSILNIAILSLHDYISIILHVNYYYFGYRYIVVSYSLVTCYLKDWIKFRPCLTIGNIISYIFV